MRVLVPGGYGLIGTEICRALLAESHEVTVLGRSATVAARVLPDLPFHQSDVSKLTLPQNWEVLEGFDAVVNCSGALQDGPDDNLQALHVTAMQALGRACAQRGIQIVQISAAGASAEASTYFMRSKAQGDAALLASGVQVTVLRPGLVLAQSSYGGSTLLRMLASVPLVQPLAMAQAQIQCVGARDVTQAVLQALHGALPAGQVYDLVEDQPHSLSQVVAAHRRALGLPPARMDITLPDWMVRIIGRLADGLGHLGWRSPLRSTALTTLQDGVRGDPTAWRAQHGPLPDLPKILHTLHLGTEHRQSARMALMMPIAVTLLALFWMVSGMIGVISLEAASAHLQAAGWPAPLARLSVLFWSAVDLALGCAILYRPTAQRACLGMIAVSLLYLIMASVVTPAVWLDPLGPLVKVLPAVGLAAITHSLLERR
jgi:uncharacterized protein YbjT (DUF2867 family)